MIELKEACEIVAMHNKGVYPCSGMELENDYCFNVIPEVANSSVCLVHKKTGECRMVHFSLVKDESILRYYDKTDLTV